VPISRVRLLAATFSAGIMLAASSSGYAQDDLKKQGDRACRADASRLCKHVLGQGEMIVLKCFQNNRAKLGRTCHAFLTKVGQLD
jgi:hypothetical protein